MRFCYDCAAPSRRQLLRYAAGGLTAGALSYAGAGRAATAQPSLTADQALIRLKEGNARYLKEPQLCIANLAGDRASHANGQAPWATILTCSDSRVAPEIIFGGLDLGELFVARNAGNVADVAVMGTIEYGAEHLGSPLVVVMGHSKCGACAAACDVVANHTNLPGSMGPMVDAITPAAKAVQGKPGDFLDNTVIENAKLNAGKIAQSPIISHLTHDGAVNVLYARYDIESGVVDFLG
jgi:carbonic anhydrase